MKSQIRNIAFVMASMISGSVFATVSADEAKQLGGPVLTEFGAERAGNKDGTIPEYTGEMIKAPPGYDYKNDPGRRPDPFNEKALFSITSKNAAQYSERLTDGAKELLKRYPDFRIDVYPTHRTHVYPKYVLDNTLKNATNCKTIKNELAVEGCYGGLPFPIPKTGAEVMWNHLLHYETHFWIGVSHGYLVPPTSSPIMFDSNLGTQTSPYYDPKRTTPMRGDEVFWQVLVESREPARLAGQKYMIFDYLDNVSPGRRAYQYIPGQRRVKLAPDLAYDTPAPSGGGSVTMDDSKLFLGAIDRYDWKLIGKKERYIPYNTFGLTDWKTCPSEKATSTKHFVNPDCVRWELHRVWVVEATLKSGFRHVYKRRVFTFDEDSYIGGMVESYDASGSMYRTAFSQMWPFYGPYSPYGSSGGTIISHDFQTGAYVTYGGQSSQGDGYWPTPVDKNITWSPESLAGQGIR